MKYYHDSKLPNKEINAYNLVELPLSIDIFYPFIVFYSHLLHPAYKMADHVFKSI